MTMATGRNLVLATVVAVKDSTICYPCCTECYSKLLFDTTDKSFWCTRCCSSYDGEQVMYRYRLLLTISERSSLCNVTVFGKTLEPFIGTTATSFNRILESLAQQCAQSICDPMELTSKALEQTFVGEKFWFGFKTRNLEHSGAKRDRPSSPLHMSYILQEGKGSKLRDSQEQNVTMVAYQMIGTRSYNIPSVLDNLKCLQHQNNNDAHDCDDTEISNSCMLYNRSVESTGSMSYLLSNGITLSSTSINPMQQSCLLSCDRQPSPLVEERRKCACFWKTKAECCERFQGNCDCDKENSPSVHSLHSYAINCVKKRPNSQREFQNGRSCSGSYLLPSDSEIPSFDETLPQPNESVLSPIIPSCDLDETIDPQYLDCKVPVPQPKPVQHGKEILADSRCYFIHSQMEILRDGTVNGSRLDLSTSLNDSSFLLECDQMERANEIIPDVHLDSPTRATITPTLSEKHANCQSKNVKLASDSNISQPKNYNSFADVTRLDTFLEDDMDISAVSELADVSPCLSIIPDPEAICEQFGELSIGSSLCRNSQKVADLWEDMPESEDLDAFLQNIVTDPNISQTQTISINEEHQRTLQVQGQSLVVGNSLVELRKKSFANKASQPPSACDDVWEEMPESEDLEVYLQNLSTDSCRTDGQRCILKVEQIKLEESKFDRSTDALQREAYQRKMEESISSAKLLKEEDIRKEDSLQASNSCVMEDMPESEDLDAFLVKLSMDPSNSSKPEPACITTDSGRETHVCTNSVKDSSNRDELKDMNPELEISAVREGLPECDDQKECSENVVDQPCAGEECKPAMHIDHGPLPASSESCGQAKNNSTFMKALEKKEESSNLTKECNPQTSACDVCEIPDSVDLEFYMQNLNIDLVCDTRPIPPVRQEAQGKDESFGRPTLTICGGCTEDDFMISSKRTSPIMLPDNHQGTASNLSGIVEGSESAINHDARMYSECKPDSESVTCPLAVFNLRSQSSGYATSFVVLGEDSLDLFDGSGYQSQDCSSLVKIYDCDQERPVRLEETYLESQVSSESVAKQSFLDELPKKFDRRKSVQFSRRLSCVSNIQLMDIRMRVAPNPMDRPQLAFRSCLKRPAAEVTNQQLPSMSEVECPAIQEEQKQPNLVVANQRPLTTAVAFQTDKTHAMSSSPTTVSACCMLRKLASLPDSEDLFTPSPVGLRDKYGVISRDEDDAASSSRFPVGERCILLKLASMPDSEDLFIPSPIGPWDKHGVTTCDEDDAGSSCFPVMSQSTPMLFSDPEESFINLRNSTGTNYLEDLNKQDFASDFMNSSNNASSVDLFTSPDLFSQANLSDFNCVPPSANHVSKLIGSKFTFQSSKEFASVNHRAVCKSLRLPPGNWARVPLSASLGNCSVKLETSSLSQASIDLFSPDFLGSSVHRIDSNEPLKKKLFS